MDPENQRQADFFCGKLNGITFPYSSGGIHFVAFFLKLPGTKNSMIFAINHPTSKNKTEAKKFLILTNLYRWLQPVSPEDIRLAPSSLNQSWAQFIPTAYSISRISSVMVEKSSLHQQPGSRRPKRPTAVFADR